MTDQDWLGAYLAQIEALIDEYGWACQNVDARTDGPETAGWAYTIGLEDQDRPELVITGLPAPTAMRVLNDLCQSAVEGRRAWPVAGDTLSGLLSHGYEIRVIAVDPEIARAGEWFNLAYARRGSADGFVALQVVWQEADRSWAVGSTAHQPLLGAPWW